MDKYKSAGGHVSYLNNLADKTIGCYLVGGSKDKPSTPSVLGAGLVLSDMAIGSGFTNSLVVQASVSIEDTIEILIIGKMKGLHHRAKFTLPEPTKTLAIKDYPLTMFDKVHSGKGFHP
ncbi:hypothetical protein VOLCADRAFT_100873 [Volvox carteri f. nagariensis]|uniref:Uncharacterized protein n=1 Tax=Volvox carteri f. nagariensis TaxID=3068 RepID=D8UL80_VOLCA|nr:uncharacterized protein VOLCADRAFT_100873 [Volvox carteri f. nagariensis]EFJ39518.1 hypothetical protein VOLCADRAFT_100873 [Volvox carteri f. nagariensis]|eukprot:XP_002959416.1 hypothetical protein VOLCADRAFT_100873 [Volvox carteri f. nagariensis]